MLTIRKDNPDFGYDHGQRDTRRDDKSDEILLEEVEAMYFDTFLLQNSWKIPQHQLDNHIEVMLTSPQQPREACGEDERVCSDIATDGHSKQCPVLHSRARVSCQEFVIVDDADQDERCPNIGRYLPSRKFLP